MNIKSLSDFKIDQFDLKEKKIKTGTMSGPKSGRKTRTRRVRRTVPVFLEKLVSMLETGPSDLIRWGNGGSTFLVLDPVRFAKTVLPKFYNTCNFSSFVRQLNFYSFSKCVLPEEKKSTTSRWEFVHKKFLRGRPDLLTAIKRKTYQDDDSPKRDEFGTLQNEVAALNNRVSSLESQIAELKELLLKGRDEYSKDRWPHKKRRISGGTYLNDSEDLFDIESKGLLTHAHSTYLNDSEDLSDIDSKGLLTHAHEAMMTDESKDEGEEEQLALFLEDMEFGPDFEDITTSASFSLKKTTLEELDMKLKIEPTYVSRSLDTSRLLDIGTGSAFRSHSHLSFESAASLFSLSPSTSLETFPAATSIFAQPTNLTENTEKILKQREKRSSWNKLNCEMLKFPPAVSEKDAQKLHQVFALMMPQIQAALLTQFQAATGVLPALSQSINSQPVASSSPQCIAATA